MKYHLLLSFVTLCLSALFSQTDLSGFEKYDTDYEREIFQKEDATHLELLMAMDPEGSHERTAEIKKQLDEFVEEVKSSGMLRYSEVKLMKELHKKVRERFLSHYKYISPFHHIFEDGQYNCVSASALFALILEELDIPYNIQEVPAHVYVMAYPDTKAISVEMTATKNAYYLPSRKDVSTAIYTLIDLGLTTPEEVQEQGQLQVYSAFYNTNDVVDLKQLAGIQYFNEAITAVNDDDFATAMDLIHRIEKLYNVEKIQYLKREVLVSLLEDAKFESMNDIAYLIEYSKLEKADQTKVFYEYASFLHQQLVSKKNRALADSSHAYIVQEIKDSVNANKLNGVYYLGLSEYFSHAFNLTQKLKYAELAYNTSPELPGVELWFVQSIIQIIDKHANEEFLSELDNYAKKYPKLNSHNLFLAGYFYAYSQTSKEYYNDDNAVYGKKYFDLALKTRDAMEDKEVLDQNHIGWLYAEAGSYFYRKEQYETARKVLEEGLKLAPNHERLVTRLEYVMLKL